MQLRKTVCIRHGGTQDIEAFERMRKARPELMAFLTVGTEFADNHLAHLIVQDSMGSTEPEIDSKIKEAAELLAASLRNGTAGESADEEQCFFARLGFMGAALEARDIYLGRALPVPNVALKP